MFPNSSYKCTHRHVHHSLLLLRKLMQGNYSVWFESWAAGQWASHSEVTRCPLWAQPCTLLIVVDGWGASQSSGAMGHSAEGPCGLLAAVAKQRGSLQHAWRECWGQDTFRCRRVCQWQECSRTKKKVSFRMRRSNHPEEIRWPPVHGIQMYLWWVCTFYSEHTYFEN